MNKNIAITLLTWNDWKNTIECLESIFQNDYNNFDVILINNGSEKYHLEKIYDWLNNKIKIYDDEIKFNENKNIKLIDITNNKKKKLIPLLKIYI